MKKIFYLFILLFSTISFSQIGIGTKDPDASSLLDITATDAGVLTPRMTENERDLIENPADRPNDLPNKQHSRVLLL